MGNKDWFPFKRISAMGRSSCHASNGNVYPNHDLPAPARLPWNFLEVGADIALRSFFTLVRFLATSHHMPKELPQF
jgi:hypothetical protein